jgi:lysophospholipase L1-like esterase
MLVNALSQFLADEKQGNPGSANIRSRRAYGTVQGRTEWRNPAYKGFFQSSPKIDLGYLVEGEKTYFLVTQGEAVIAGDASGRVKSLRISYRLNREQVELLAEVFGNSSYDYLMLFLGDSVTAGTSAVTPEVDDRGKAFPALLAELVKIPVINSGINWNTSAMALERLNEDVLGRNPTIVVINLGFSDFLQRIPPRETMKNLQSIISTLNEGERKIYLTRFYDEDILRGFMQFWEMNEEAQLELLYEYDDIFAQLARNNNIELITGIWEGLAQGETISEDYINPNAEGHKLMAQNYLRVLRPFLEERKLLR